MPRLISRAELEKLAERAMGAPAVRSQLARACIARALEADPLAGGLDVADTAKALRAIRTLAVDVAMFGDAIERFMLAPEGKD